MDATAEVSFKNTETAFENKTNKELKSSYWLFTLMNNQSITNVGTFFIKLALELKFPIKNIIKKTLFRQFCGGENILECETVMSKLFNSHIHSILDYSVESAEGEEDFKNNLMEIVSTIKKASENKSISFAVFKCSALTHVSLLEKYQKKESLSIIEIRHLEYFKARFETICREAFLNDVKVLVDAEESWIQGVIDEYTFEMMKKYNQKKAIVFATFQMYRNDKLEELNNLIQVSKNEKFIVGVKLVRGAYHLKEIEYAIDNKVKCKVYKRKEETDKAYNSVLELMVKNLSQFSICLGTHNEESNYFLMKLLKENEIQLNDPRIFVAQLYGMSDHISYNLAKAGLNTSKYLPYGPVEKVMPYLFRRAEENTSISGQSSRELEMVKIEMNRRKLSVY